jgi:hypothetical protein
MASLTSYNHLVSYLRQPPPPFEGDPAGAVEDPEELPDIDEIISGQYSVLIDITGDSDKEVYHHLHETRKITDADFSGHVGRRAVSLQVSTTGFRGCPCDTDSCNDQAVSLQEQTLVGAPAV